MEYADFTIPAQDLILATQIVANEQGHKRVTFVHMLRALLLEDFRYVIKDLEPEMRSTLDSVLQKRLTHINEDQISRKKEYLSKRMNRVLRSAKRYAQLREGNRKYINEYDIVFSLLSHQEDVCEVFLENGVSAPFLRSKADTLVDADTIRAFKKDRSSKDISLFKDISLSKDLANHIADARNTSTYTMLYSEVKLETLMLKIIDGKTFLNDELGDDVVKEIGKDIFALLPAKGDSKVKEELLLSKQINEILDLSKSFADSLDLEEVSTELFIASLVKADNELAKLFQKKGLKMIDCIKYIS